MARKSDWRWRDLGEDRGLGRWNAGRRDDDWTPWRKTGRDADGPVRPGHDRPGHDRPGHDDDGQAGATGSALKSSGGGGGKAGGNGIVSRYGSAPTDITLSNDDVDENSPGGTLVGYLGAVDADGRDRFTFRLLDDAGGLFAINGRKKLVVADGADIDYEQASSHQITVQVTDRAGNTYVETITIRVNDLPDTPTNTPPTDIVLSSQSVDENAAPGTVVGTLSNDDPDTGDSWSYAIVDDPDQVFAIVGDKLVVREGAVLDYETAPAHQVTIRVIDSAGASYTESFTINVNDLPEQLDSAPYDITLSGAAVAEGAESGTVIGTLGALDPDAGETFRFVLLDSASGRFALEGDQLVLANTSLIDYEASPVHQVTVRVYDSTGLSYDESFAISVGDSVGIAEQPIYVRALLADTEGTGDYQWPDADPSDQKITVTYAILTDFPSYYDPANLPFTDYANGGEVPFSPLTSAQLTAIAQLLAEVEEFTNIDFVQVATGEEASVTFGAYYMDPGVGAYAYYPWHDAPIGGTPGDVWLNSRYDTYPSTSEEGRADWARTTIAHELGHALGLKHPGNYDAGGWGPPPPYLDPSVDNAQYTVMSYNDFPYSSYNPLDYMLYDLAALQYLYGANATHASGDDVYLIDPGAARIDTIWDAGGHDTLSAAGASAGVTLDLNQGAFSSIGITNNIGIAWGTDIEDAVGGSGDDRIVGNHLDNTLSGGVGADVFVFLDDWGNDTVADFEDGLDLLDLSETGYVFEDLSISAELDGALIAAGESTILLSGVDAALLDQSDFVFV